MLFEISLTVFAGFLIILTAKIIKNKRERLKKEAEKSFGQPILDQSMSLKEKKIYYSANEFGPIWCGIRLDCEEENPSDTE